MMTTDDVLSPRSASPQPIESDVRTTSQGSPVKNPRAILESAITKMSELDSLRIRMQLLSPSGPLDAVIETMKPDRLHVTSSLGEMISIGRKFYVKGNGGWSVTTGNDTKAAAFNYQSAAQSDAGLDFKTVVKQSILRPGFKITGQLLGTQTVDGIDTDAYAFEVSDGKETGKVELYLGKDGYMRQMFLTSAAFYVKLWFTNLNEPLSIESPM